MEELPITGFGTVEVRTKKFCEKLERFLAHNKVGEKPTHKIKIKIEGFIDDGTVNRYDGVGQEFGLDITKAVIGDFSSLPKKAQASVKTRKRDAKGHFTK